MLCGSGIGLLVSSAISLAQTLEQLPVLGAQAVGIAFCLGVKVSEKAQSLEIDNDEHPAASWAYVVHDIMPEQAQKELDEMHSKEVSHPLLSGSLEADKKCREFLPPQEYSSVQKMHPQ